MRIGRVLGVSFGLCACGGTTVSHGGSPDVVSDGGSNSGTGGTVSRGGASAGGGDGGSSSSGGRLGTDAGIPEAGGAPGSGGSPADSGPREGLDCSIYDFHMRNDASGSPFPLPGGTTDLYQCFSFHKDTLGAKQAYWMYPQMYAEDADKVEHLLLYKASGSVTDGTSSPCIGFNASSTLIAAWIPGVGSFSLPEDVGLEFDSNDFILEAHLQNTTAVNQVVTSGLQLCVGSERPNTATISWLGNDIFGGFGTPGIPPNSQGAEIQGRCKPSFAEPIHTVLSLPWMRQLGRRLNARIDRADGSTETLLDAPFTFGAATTYPTPAVLNPGDSILTTCTFDNPSAFPVAFGETTASEHCYDLTVAYPPRALIGGGLQNNSCISAP